MTDLRARAVMSEQEKEKNIMKPTYHPIDYATDYLGISRVWLRRLVYEGRVTAYCHDDQAQLRKRQPHEHPTRLFFTQADLDAFQQTRKAPGRPNGAKDKKTRKVASQA